MGDQPRQRNGRFREQENAEPPPRDLERLASEHTDLLAVPKSAAALQRSVRDAAASSVAAMNAGHRDSYHHDHVVADLMERYDAVLEAAKCTHDGLPA
jgi:hypothetical protein